MVWIDWLVLIISSLCDSCLLRMIMVELCCSPVWTCKHQNLFFSRRLKVVLWLEFVSRSRSIPPKVWPAEPDFLLRSNGYQIDLTFFLISCPWMSLDLRIGWNLTEYWVLGGSLICGFCLSHVFLLLAFGWFACRGLSEWRGFRDNSIFGLALHRQFFPAWCVSQLLDQILVLSEVLFFFLLHL